MSLYGGVFRIIYGVVCKRSKLTDCKSVPLGSLVRIQPAPPNKERIKMLIDDVKIHAQNLKVYPEHETLLEYKWRKPLFGWMRS